MSSFVGLDFSRNLSYFGIPATFLTMLVTHTYSIVAAGFDHYDSANPRDFKDTVSKSDRLDKPTKRLVARSKAATDNQLETMGLYAAAVVAANQAGLDTWELNVLSLGYVALRVLYAFSYIILGQNRQLASLRSIFWMAAMGATMTMYVKAGLKLMG